MKSFAFLSAVFIAVHAQADSFNFKPAHDLQRKAAVAYLRTNACLNELERTYSPGSCDQWKDAKNRMIISMIHVQATAKAQEMPVYPEYLIEALGMSEAKQTIGKFNFVIDHQEEIHFKLLKKKQDKQF